MTLRRCYLPSSNQSGSLQLVTIARDTNYGLFKHTCLQQALDKWLSLFTIQILEYSLSELGLVMLAYVPNQALSLPQAIERTRAFDQKIRNEAKNTWCPHPHSYSPEELNSLSKFMMLFVRDFMLRHKRYISPKKAPDESNSMPAPKGRYRAKTVQHDSLPPLFSPNQIKTIRTHLRRLNFTTDAEACDLRNLYISSHGIGSKSFLEDLEKRCLVHLSSSTHSPMGQLRIPSKNITPFTAQAWDKRLAELVGKQVYEYYPHVWSTLMNLDILTHKLTNPDCFTETYGTGKRASEAMCLSCLPFSIALMLTDGLLRWYYKTAKGTAFPYYNEFRELRPWELPESKQPPPDPTTYASEEDS